MPTFDFNLFNEMTNDNNLGEGTPQEEFFHSVFVNAKKIIEGKVTLKPDQLQIRNVEYNLNEVFMIITKIKNIYVKEVEGQNNRKNTVCFSYLEGNQPYQGTSGKYCGLTKSDRVADDFCKDCKAQIILAGIYCDKNGNYITDEEGQPVFIFLRGKGARYGNIGNYVSKLVKKEYDPFFKESQNNPDLIAKEKKIINPSRVVTKVTHADYKLPHAGTTTYVFVLEDVYELDNKKVLEVLTIASESEEKFNTKFNWSKSPKLLARAELNKKQSAMSMEELKKQKAVNSDIDDSPFGNNDEYDKKSISEINLDGF